MTTDIERLADDMPFEAPVLDWPVVPLPFKSYNHRGNETTVFLCQSCGGLFSVIPPVPREKWNEWTGCMDEDCPSYDLGRDAMLYFGSDMMGSEPVDE